MMVCGRWKKQVRFDNDASDLGGICFLGEFWESRRESFLQGERIKHSMNAGRFLLMFKIQCTTSNASDDFLTF